jgi:hypothetical protein
MKIQKIYKIGMILLGMNTSLHPVNPEALLFHISATRHREQEEKALARQGFFATAAVAIKKAVAENEMSVMIKMEVAVESPGFFGVESILESPERCQEIVQVGVGSERYAQLLKIPSTARMRGVVKRLKSLLSKKSKEDRKEEGQVQRVEEALQVHLDEEGEEVREESKLPVTSLFLSAEECEGVHHLIRQEMTEAEKRIANHMESVVLGRSRADLRRVMDNSDLCRRIVRQGLPKGARKFLWGKEKERALEGDEKESISRGTQTEDEIFIPKTKEEALEALMRGAQLDSVLIMSARKVSHMLSVLEVKKSLTDQHMCEGIVAVGLGDEAHASLSKIKKPVSTASGILV